MSNDKSIQEEIKKQNIQNKLIQNDLNEKKSEGGKGFKVLIEKQNPISPQLINKRFNE